MAVLLRSCFLFTASLLPCVLFPFLCPDSLFARRLGGGWVAVEGGVAACGAWHVGGIAQHTVPARCAARRSDLSTLRPREPRVRLPILSCCAMQKAMLLYLTPPHLSLPIDSFPANQFWRADPAGPAGGAPAQGQDLKSHARAGRRGDSGCVCWPFRLLVNAAVGATSHSIADLRTACALWAGRRRRVCRDVFAELRFGGAARACAAQLCHRQIEVIRL